MTLDELFTAASRLYGFETPAADEDGTYALLCGNAELTVIPVGQTQALLYAPVSDPVLEVDGPLADVLLQSNHLFAGARGASFAKDPDSQRFCLQQILEFSHLDGESFAEALSTFLSEVERWQVIVGQRQLAEGAETTSAPETEDTAHHPFGPSSWIPV